MKVPPPAHSPSLCLLQNVVIPASFGDLKGSINIALFVVFKTLYSVLEERTGVYIISHRYTGARGGEGVGGFSVIRYRNTAPGHIGTWESGCENGIRDNKIINTETFLGWKIL